MLYANYLSAVIMELKFSSDACWYDEVNTLITNFNWNKCTNISIYKHSHIIKHKSQKSSASTITVGVSPCRHSNYSSQPSTCFWHCLHSNKYSTELIMYIWKLTSMSILYVIRVQISLLLHRKVETKVPVVTIHRDNWIFLEHLVINVSL